METVFDTLKAMGKASSQEVAARLGMTRDEAINELWKLKRRGWADNKGPMWWLTNEKSDENDSVTQAPKVTAQMLIEFIGQEGAKTCEELAGKFGVSIRTYAVNCNDAWLNTEGDDISGSYVKYKDHQEVVAALEAKCAALAAENAALKQSEKEFNNFCRQEYYGWEDNFTETPATDAFLAEVRAVAFDELRAAFVRHAKVAELDDADTVTPKEVMDALLHCVEQLRAPE